MESFKLLLTVPYKKYELKQKHILTRYLSSDDHTFNQQNLLYQLF